MAEVLLVYISGLLLHAIYSYSLSRDDIADAAMKHQLADSCSTFGRLTALMASVKLFLDTGM